MLHHEQHIKQNAHIRQTQLHRIARQAAPIVLQRAVGDQLHQAENPAAKVEKYLPDGPARCRFAAVVGERLRDVFEDCKEDFDVGEGIDLMNGVRRDVVG